MRDIRIHRVRPLIELFGLLAKLLSDGDNFGAPVSEFTHHLAQILETARRFEEPQRPFYSSSTRQRRRWTFAQTITRKKSDVNPVLLEQVSA